MTVIGKETYPLLVELRESAVGFGELGGTPGDLGFELLLRRDLTAVLALELLRHEVEGLSEPADLVLLVVAHAVSQVAPPDRRRRLAEGAQWRRDRSVEADGQEGRNGEDRRQHRDRADQQPARQLRGLVVDACRLRPFVGDCRGDQALELRVETVLDL